MHAASVVNDVPRKRLVAPPPGSTTSGSSGLQNNTASPTKRKTVPSLGAGSGNNLCSDTLVATPTSSGRTAATAATSTTTGSGAGPSVMNQVEMGDPSSSGGKGTAKPKPQHELYRSGPGAPQGGSNDNDNNNQSGGNAQQASLQPRLLPQHTQMGTTQAQVSPRPAAVKQRSKGEKMDESPSGKCSGPPRGDDDAQEDDSSISSCSSYDSDDSCSSGSSSWTSSTTGSSGPQHLDPMEESMHPDLEFAVIAHRRKGMLLSRLSEVSTRGNLSLINLARRGLGVNDAALIGQVIIENPTLSVLKLGYNELGDIGAHCIANALSKEEEGILKHRPLQVLDLSFNGIGDAGCETLAMKALAGNSHLRTLFLAGNNIGEKGTLSIAGALVHGCFLSRLHLSANKIGPEGIKGLATAMAEIEARLQAQECPEQNKVIMGTGIDSTHGTNLTVQRMEHLYLGSTSMESAGFYAIPSMLLTNTSLRVLCLTDNGITDEDMSVLAQALTQNKNVPLESILLSFNQITDTGVECLMNAIWGSPTLKEIKLDNNKMQDRGAQLCAVVLTSVNLEKLDISFNAVSTVGVRALMKTLSEDTNVKSLGMCGIPIDLNGAKAVSFALAYNTVIESVFMDNCQIGYSAQRHIVAGIVSNQKAPLKHLTGYPIGPITVTLGMPQLPEEWSNEQVLTFVRMMWRNWGKKRGPPSGEEGDDGEEEVKGPAPPAAVAAAAKIAFAALGSDPTAALYVEPKQNESYDYVPSEMNSPLIPANAALIERTPSGRLKVPGTDNAEDGDGSGFVEAWTEASSLGRPAVNQPVSSRSGLEPLLDNPEQRNRNLRWLRTHFRPLIDVGKLPFNNADMWQLHQYYFSPPYFADNANDDSKPAAKDDDIDDPKIAVKKPESSNPQEKTRPKKEKVVAPPSTPIPDEKDSKTNNMGRAISFQTLSSAVAAADLTNTSHKRRGHDEEVEDEHSRKSEPVTKRSKSLKPRIAYYPRIRAKLETLGTKPLEQTLCLLRKLKYVENVIFPEHTDYEELDRLRESDNRTRLDIEMILLDLI